MTRVRRRFRHMVTPDSTTGDRVHDDAFGVGKFVRASWKKMFDTTAKCAQKGNAYLLDHLQEATYILAVFGGWTVVFIKVYPLLTDVPTIPAYHKTVGKFVFALCVASWRYAANTNPGNITQLSLTKYDNYEYDGWLYRRGNVCPTLHIRKLARSKYDKYSDRHVPRFDHHCGWIGQPIGEENYRFFIVFLAVHETMCTYGAVVVSRLLWHQTLETGLINRKMALLYVFYCEVWISLTLVLMISMMAVLGAFLAFHLYLIATNTTTNEYYKWKDIRSWHEGATIAYQCALRNGTIREGSTGVQHPSRFGVTYHQVIRRRGRGHEEEDTVHVTVDDFVVDPGPMPSNAYDIGFLGNIHEVMFPRSLRRRSEHRSQT